MARELGTYLMVALPNATIIRFTGTPIAKTPHGEVTFKIFGTDDDLGCLDKYTIGPLRMRRHCPLVTPWHLAR